MQKIPSKTDDSVLRVVRNQTVYVEWEIHNLFNKTYVNGEYFESPTFSLSDAEWLMQFYPNHATNVYLDLIKKKSLMDVRVSVAIGIKKGKDSAFKSIYTNWLFEKNKSGRTALNFPTSELLQCKDVVAPNGVLTVFLMACKLDGSSEDVAAEAACQTPSNGFGTLSQNFKELFLSEGAGDVTFKVGEKEFSAHKLVLTTRSTVFHTMFEVDMVERNEGTVDISDSDPEHFEKFLLYLYSGEMEFITSSNALGLCLLADKYNLKELRENCCKCLAQEITVDSFCDVALLASLHNESELLETAVNYFIKNADVILPTPKWVTFNAEHSTLANELLIKMAIFFKTLLKN